jgi:predicted molibdopterin-dependent oxidoreductase YjgC
MFRKIDGDAGAAGLVSITIDGVPTSAEEGEPLAAVLLRTPPFFSRVTPVSGSIRAPYCMMGACFECLVELDGETSTRSCLSRVQDGMIVRRQPHRPDPLRGSSS